MVRPLNLKPVPNDRGFSMFEFNDAYGERCSLQKSSLATEDAIWFGIHDVSPKIMGQKAQNGPHSPGGEPVGWVDYPIHPDVLLNSRMHLTRDQVAELLPFLQEFVETGELPSKKKRK